MSECHCSVNAVDKKLLNLERSEMFGHLEHIFVRLCAFICV